MQGVEIKALGAVFYPSVWVVVVLTCALGGFIGAVNGVLIAYLKVPAFVATLGVLYCARGVALLLTNGLTYNNLGLQYLLQRSHRRIGSGRAGNRRGDSAEQNGFRALGLFDRWQRASG